MHNEIAGSLKQGLGLPGHRAPFGAGQGVAASGHPLDNAEKDGCVPKGFQSGGLRVGRSLVKRRLCVLACSGHGGLQVRRVEVAVALAALVLVAAVVMFGVGR
jgi:hypothetical protein